MSKYEDLAKFAKLNKYETLTEIAELAKQKFSLPESVDTIRKGISKELKKQSKINVSDVAKSYIQLSEELNRTVESLPKTLKRKQEFKEPGTYLLLGCTHVPGHNQSMINGITKLIGDINIKGLMLLGDFLDCNSLSGHDKDKFTAIKGLTLDQEYQEGNKVLDELFLNCPNDIEKVYIYGNHEDRWNRYMSNMQNAKTPITSPEIGLKLKERGFNIFTNWSSDFVKLGEHLELIHGQYYNTHCAKQHIDKFRGSVAFVHTHRIQMYVEGKTAGFNIGWGGDANHPFFNYCERGTKNQWQNGFALCTIDEYGDYFMQQIFHHNNKFYYNGKVYN